MWSIICFTYSQLIVDVNHICKVTSTVTSSRLVSDQTTGRHSLAKLIKKIIHHRGLSGAQL